VPDDARDDDGVFGFGSRNAATSEDFRVRVEAELAEQRERVGLRRSEHEALAERAATIAKIVDDLALEAARDVTGEEERRAIALALREAELAALARRAATGSGAGAGDTEGAAAAAAAAMKLPALPRRVGYSSAAVVDAAAEAKIEQLHQVVHHMAAEQQMLRTRVAAAEYESGEKAERISELEATIVALTARLAGAEQTIDRLTAESSQASPTLRSAPSF
jgi:hypothetical protein